MEYNFRNYAIQWQMSKIYKSHFFTFVNIAKVLHVLVKVTDRETDGHSNGQAHGHRRNLAYLPKTVAFLTYFVIFSERSSCDFAVLEQNGFNSTLPTACRKRRVNNLTRIFQRRVHAYESR